MLGLKNYSHTTGTKALQLLRETVLLSSANESQANPTEELGA